MPNPVPKRPKIHDGWNVFLEDRLNLFPVYVRNDYWLHRWVLPQHRQPGIEINVTHIGRALLSVDHHVYPQLDRQIVAFPGTCTHEFEVDGTNPYAQTVICLDESLLGTLLQARQFRVNTSILDCIRQGYFDFHIVPERWVQINTICNQLVEAFRHKTHWWEQVVSSCIAELVDVLFQSTLPTQNEDLSLKADWLQLCRSYIDRNLDQRLSLHEVARKFYVSPEHLTRTFHKIYGVPFQRYVYEQRIKAACRMLTSQQLSIAEIADTVGFQSRPHFHRAFREMMGVTPGEYRNIRKCPLG